MRALPTLGVLVIAGLSGCSGLIRGMVDTQPRVDIDALSLSHPGTVVHGDPVVYLPAAPAATSKSLDPDLIRFAPAIVQGFVPESTTSPAYPRTDDAIGSPVLSMDAQSVRIDTSQPAVFTRVEFASVNSVRVKQLVYAFWYPRRPVGSIETGAVDGGILRVTLDTRGQPSIFEYSQPCGCFHGVFVAEALNAASAAQFGAPAPHRLHSVEAPLSGHDDWVVRELVPTLPGGRITLYMSAGKHFCSAITDLSPDDVTISRLPSKAYAIARYESLEHLARDGGGFGSMFDGDRRVIGAQRKTEQFMLGDLDHAGWPRHLDKMLIHWDAEHWTDPTLLATKLRLPATLTSDNGSPAPIASVPTISPTLPAPAAASSGRRLMLFTNASCLGCQLTKQTIKQSPGLQRAIRNWQYEVIDTATTEGAQLAAEHRVTVVPILIGFDGPRELFREEDIDTPEKIASAISRKR